MSGVSRTFSVHLSALLAHFGEAFAAVYRTVGLGFERNTSLSAASSTGSGEIFARATSRVLSGVTAGLAALRLVLETALCIEFLLAGRKHKFLTAFLAY